MILLHHLAAISKINFKNIHVYAMLVIIPFELKVTLIALTKNEGVKDAFVSF